MNNSRTLLVTGGAGFIGSNFVLYWLKNHVLDKIIVLDSLTYAGNRENLSSVDASTQFEFVKGDICNQQLVESLLLEYKIDTIVHFAAESHVDRSITGPDSFIETNILGTYSLLKAAKKVWLDMPAKEEKTPITHRFHHVSTDEVYGTLTPNEPAFTENTAYAPNSPYSASKAASDHLVRAYHHTYGLDVTTSNCSNNYGPLHFPEKLIPLIITNILFDKSLPIYGDGKQIRDWLYVEDHVRGIELVINKGQSGENYNIGGHNEWTNIDIVELVCRLVDEAFAKNPEYLQKYPCAKKAASASSSGLITFVKDRLGHDRRYAIDATKTERELGYIPEESFESGIRKTIIWYLENSNWWEAILDGSYQSEN